MKKNRKRAAALTLALSMTLPSLLSSATAMTLPAEYDEAYYATLDYYGTVTEGSVVKSYRLNGADTVTDYGTYDKVVNLTDNLSPVVDNGTVTFSLGENAPTKFYFEGKTTQPFEALPWSISVSYKLNGAPALAETLAGKTGLVEICLDIVPNPAASAYSRDNLVLTAATAFNDDDILSLSAPGAEVQMVGNLRTVLYVVLPGEEQHFSIQVGSEDFSFAGLVFLAVPATLQQLEKVADLKEAKETGEDSLDAINDSLDVILDSLSGMSGSLNTTAKGLDALNAARSKVSSGKGAVYDSTDKALDGLNAMTAALGTMDAYTATASQAITDLNTNLNEMNTTVQTLTPELENTRKIIQNIQFDVEDLKGLLGEVEGYNKKATAIASSLADETEELEDELAELQFTLDLLESALANTKGISTLKNSDLLGMLSADEAAQMREVLTLHASYEDYLEENSLKESDLSFKNFIIASAYQQYRTAVAAQVSSTLVAATPGATAEDVASQVESLLSPAATAEALTAAGITDPTTQAKIIAAQSQSSFLANSSISGQYVSQATAASNAYDEFSAKLPMVDTINKKIKEVNAIVLNITDPTARLVRDLSDICELLDENGGADDLHALAALSRDLLKTLKKHEGEGAALLDDANEAGDLLARISETADTALTELNDLNSILNTYEPQLQSALTDLSVLSTATQDTLRDTAAALKAMEELLRSAGPELDAGTASSLSGLSQALRQATVGLDRTDTIRNAKTTITDLIDDQWDEHSGGVDGLLNMDATATPESITDSRNPAPRSVQYVMRTQEIKVEEAVEETSAEAIEDTSTVWSRVLDMFKGLWDSFKKLLHIG